MAVALAIVAFSNKIWSSAKHKCVIANPLLPCLTPVISPSNFAIFNNLEKPSAHTIKRYGLKGSHCLNPLGEAENSAPFTPFIITEQDTFHTPQNQINPFNTET